MALTMHMMMQITQVQNHLQSQHLSQAQHFSTALSYPLPIMSLLYCDMYRPGCQGAQLGLKFLWL